MNDSLITHLDSQAWTVRQPSNLPLLVIEESFLKAVTEARTASDDPILGSLQATGKSEDVLNVLKDAQFKHGEEMASKTWKWTSKLSSSIMHYSRVLDAITQHNPKYVALFWGTLKFLLLGVINYEKMVKELCKALNHVAESLRHVQLNLLLYPTDAMREAATKLYLHIITFTTRAVKWYERRRVPKALSILSTPFELKFRDVVDDIIETSRSMDRLALSLSQVENRQMRLEITETRKLAQDIKSALDAYSQLHHCGLIDTNKRISDVQFSQILDFLANSSLPDPEHVRHHYASRRNLRRRKQNSVPHTSLSSSRLQEWGASAESSQVFVQGSFRYRQLARDFAVDMIDLISKANVPVVWALDPTFDSPRALTSVDVLKHITLQILRLNHTMLNERAATLSAAQFQSTVTESGWFSLLGSALEGLQQLYIIIDLEVLDRSTIASCTWLEEFPRLFQGLSARNVRTTLKVAFISPRGTNEYTPEQTFRQTVVKLFSGSASSMVNATARSRRNERSLRKGRKKSLFDFRPGEHHGESSG